MRECLKGTRRDARDNKNLIFSELYDFPQVEIKTLKPRFLYDSQGLTAYYGCVTLLNRDDVLPVKID